MAKNIQTPPRIYDYIAELSCYAKSEQNRLTHFLAGGIEEVWVFLLTHKINQSNKFFHLVYRSHMEGSETIIMAQIARFYA